MKYGRWCLAICLVLLSVTSGVAADKVRLATGEWPPYVSEGLEHHGAVSRMVTDAFAAEGLAAEITFLPWKRAYEQARAGDFDGTFAWSRESDRERDFYYSDPIFSDSMVFFHLKQMPFEWETMDDLKGLRIGCTLGYNYGDAFRAAEKAGKLTIDWVPKDMQNFRKLLRERVALVPLEAPAGYYILRNHFTPEEIGKVTYHPKAVRTGAYYLLLPKRLQESRKLLTVFNRGLKQLRQRGAIDAYLKNSQEGHDPKR